MGLKELMERYAYYKPDMIGWYSLVVDELVISTNEQETTVENITLCENEIADDTIANQHG